MCKLLFRTVAVIIVLMQCLSFFSVCCFAQNDDYAVFSVESVYAGAEAETCAVSIYIENNPGIAAGDFKINSDLKILSIEDEKFSVVANESEGLFNWSSAINKYTTGKMVTLVFELPKSSGAERSWSVDLIINDLFNENVEEVGSLVNSGTVTKEVSADGNFDVAFVYSLVMAILNFFRSFYEILNNAMI